MISIPSPNPQWTITDWVCRPDSHDFHLWASPQLMKQARKTRLDQANLQHLARLQAESAKLLKAGSTQDLLLFNEWGVAQFNWPMGGGGWLSLSMSGQSEFLTRGAVFSTHNVDTSKQQSFLMSLWLLWIRGLETENR